MTQAWSGDEEPAVDVDRFAAHAGYDPELGLGDPPRATDPHCVKLTALIDQFEEDDHTTRPLGDGRSDAETLNRLRDLRVLIDRLEAHHLHLLRAAEQGGVLQRDGFGNASLWLRRTSNLSSAEAARRAKVARRLEGLPEIAAAMAEGRIGVAHASLIERMASDVGLEKVAAVQRPLIVAATRLRDVAEFATLCAGWRQALAPDYLDERDDENWERRRAVFTTLNGRGHLWGDFDAEGAALIATAIDALTTEDSPETPVDARRSHGQRVADAIVDMAARILDLGQAPMKAGQRPHVSVRLNAETVAGEPGSPPAQADWVGPIGRRTALRFLGDSSLTRVLCGQRSQPLDVGTATRIWPAAIRKAITCRDEHCRFPGCDRPAAWCQIDHVQPVEDHGTTRVDNGILLCRPHHRMKRRDSWWPTLQANGDVTWTHPVHDDRLTHPASYLQGWVETLLTAADDPCRDEEQAGETRATYDAKPTALPAPHAPPVPLSGVSPARRHDRVCRRSRHPYPSRAP